MKRSPKTYNLFKKNNCEIDNNCLGPLDIDHVKTFASGGKDEESNCMTLCRKHHTEKGAKGLIHFADKYHVIKIWLLNYGWQICPLRKKWIKYD
jgi:5-methylcytosine-specific restriction endonuclease McrA